VFHPADPFHPLGVNLRLATEKQDSKFDRHKILTLINYNFRSENNVSLVLRGVLMFLF